MWRGENFKFVWPACSLRDNISVLFSYFTPDIASYISTCVAFLAIIHFTFLYLIIIIIILLTFFVPIPRVVQPWFRASPSPQTDRALCQSASISVGNGRDPRLVTRLRTEDVSVTYFRVDNDVMTYPSDSVRWQLRIDIMTRVPIATIFPLGSPE